MKDTIVAIFNKKEDAEAATTKIRESGISTNEISIVALDERYGRDRQNFHDGQNIHTGDNHFPNESDATSGSTGYDTYDQQYANGQKPVNDNISGGAVSGATFGGIAGLVLGMGTIAIPGLGVIAAAGPIAGLLTGAVTGGIIGGLIDLGIPEKDSTNYEDEIRQGGVLFSMPVDHDTAGKVSQILKSCGAKRVEYHKNQR